MTLAARLQRAIPEIEAAATRGEDHLALRLRIAQSLARLVGYDVACVATLDPVTVMWTHCAVVGMERDHRLEAALFEAEYRREDVAKMEEVAGRPSPVSILSAETRGDLAASARYRDAFEAAGWTDELRLVLADGGAPWASVQLLRSGRRRFDEDEAAALATVSAPLGRAVRHALLRAAAQRPAEVERDPPGLLLMGPGDAIAEASPEAIRLVGEPLAEKLPAAVHGIAARTRAGEPASASAPAPGGGFLLLHGTRLGDRVAVVVERARALQLAEVVVRALGLTPRERQLVELVARGKSTKEISTALGISEWTVQDHLKSVFAKTGVSTRQELVAALFFGHWAPEHERSATPSPYGHFLRRG